jgi:hypothetical protein
VDPEPPAVPILKSMPADESHAEKALPVGLTDEKPQLIEPEPETVRVELAPFVAKSAPVDTSPIAKPTHPKSAEPKSAEPEPVDPKSVEPTPVDPKPAEPKPIDPKSAEPEPIDPKSVEPKPVNPKPVEPEPIDPKSAEPKPVNPKPVNPKPADPKFAEPKPVDPKPIEPEPIDPKSAEPEPPAVPISRDMSAPVAKITVPVGIENVGNSCYVASLMQVLFQNKQFRKTVAALCERLKQSGDEHRKLLHHLNDIFSHLENGSSPYPRKRMEKFLQTMRNLGWETAHGQDDSSVLLLWIKERLDELQVPNGAAEVSKLKAKLLPLVETSRIIEPLVQTGPEKIVYDVASGISDFTLQPTGQKLDEMLDGLFAEDEHTGADQYEHDGMRVDARSKIIVSGELPDDLIIPVGRKFFTLTGAPAKNTNTLEFPECIDMCKHTLNPDGSPCWYDLDGVIAHYGSAESGHYISCVKRDGQWSKCNDGCVIPITWSEVKQLDGRKKDGPLATMLYYRRRSPENA